MARVTKSFQSGPQKVLERLADVIEVCDDLVEQIDTLSLAVDDIKQRLSDLAEEKPDLNAILQPVKRPPKRRPDPPVPSVAYPLTVALKWGPNSVEARIDAQSVRLSPKLGLLLESLLADDMGGTSDARSGWKTRAELVVRLGKLTGKAVTKHALENLISRLKKELRNQARLDLLVQSDQRLGVRFALRKYAAAQVD